MVPKKIAEIISIPYLLGLLLFLQYDDLISLLYGSVHFQFTAQCNDTFKMAPRWRHT